MRRMRSDAEALLIGSTAIRMWFPDFRRPKDIDIYAMGGYDKKFMAVNRPKKTMVRTGRKLVVISGNNVVDIIMHTNGSHIPDIIKYCRDGGVEVTICKMKLILASPMALRMIKDIVSRFPKKQKEHKADLEFLKKKVPRRYTHHERQIVDKGVRHLKLFFDGRNDNIFDNQ